MEFKQHLKNQIALHASVQPQDIVKHCYQAAFGAEHLLSDVERARTWFHQEYDAVEAKEGLLYEQLSDTVCRVNFAVWKARGFSEEELFEKFVQSATLPQEGEEVFLNYLVQAEEVIREMQERNATVLFTLNDWKDYLTWYRTAGMPAVHHSDAYRRAENPSYRIIFMNFSEK